MLLNEILTDTSIDDQGRAVLKPRMDAHDKWPAGIKRQVIRPSKEEQDDPNIAKIVQRVGEIPIVSAYVLPQKVKVGAYDARSKKKYTEEDALNNERLKDAMKMRNPLHVMAEEDIRDVARKAVEKIISIKPRTKAMRGKRDLSVAHLFDVQKRLKSEDAIIVPIASSSSLPDMIAEEASKVLGIPLLKGFEKRIGKTSKHYWTKEHGYRERPSYGPDLEAELEKREADVHAMYGNKNISKEQIRAAETELEQFRVKAKRQSSKGRAQIDHRRGIYKIQEVVDEQLLDLEDKDVIFVDDNVYTGLTFQGAFLALADLGISPRTVSGITMHEFY